MALPGLTALWLLSRVRGRTLADFGLPAP